VAVCICDTKIVSAIFWVRSGKSEKRRRSAKQFLGANLGRSF